MKILGLTGGIGSGKTTVAREFEKLGVPLFIADLEAKKILNSDGAVKSAIKQLLGPDSYILNQGIEEADRSFIATKVFNDPKLLKSLNAIVHPAVAAQFEEWKRRSTYPYGVYEAAILFETGGESRCDLVLLVAAQKELRIARVMKRDGVTRQEVESRMSNQWSQNRKLDLSNMVINNINHDEIPVYVKYINEFMLNN